MHSPTQSRRPPAGVLDPSRIGAMPASAEPSVVRRFLALDDLSSTVSDILDGLGVPGALPASSLPPTLPQSRIVGPAVTVRNTPHRFDPYAAASQKDWQMAEVEGIQQADPGDILVIEGLPEISNMGGIMATLSKRQGVAGAIVDGGVRDVGQSRRLGFPIWARHHTPVTGKWRCVTEEVNGPVHICGVVVHAGDFVIADETGICFVPHGLVEDVLRKAEATLQKEEQFNRLLASDTSVADFVRELYPPKK